MFADHKPSSENLATSQLTEFGTKPEVAFPSGKAGTSSSRLALNWLCLFALTLILSVFVPDRARAASGYHIGAQDKIRITVSDWPPGGQDFRTRLDGIFTVDTAGNLSLPLIGDVPVSGLSSQEVGAAIAENFRLKLGTILSPTASVEIVEFRPFYIVGVVDRPGSYPYRPNMTVLHAVSIAGGFFRRRETDFPRLQREMVSAFGDVSLHKASRDPLIARKARLQAELEGRDMIEFPAELAERRGDERIARLMWEEAKLLTHHQATLEAGLKEQALIKEAAQKQSAALVSQEAAQEKQLNVAKRELDDQSDIVARGLARRAVLFPIEQRVGEAEAKKRQLHADQLKNAQDILKADQAGRSLRSNRQTEAMESLRETETALSQLNQRINTATRLAQNAELETMKSGGEVQPVYTILRQEGSSLRELPAHEIAEVLPGDIVRVILQPQGRPGPVAAQTLPDPAIPAPVQTASRP